MLQSLRNTKNNQKRKLLFKSIVSAIGLTIITTESAFAALDLIGGGWKLFNPILLFLDTFTVPAAFVSAVFGAYLAPGELRAKVGYAFTGAVLAALVFKGLPAMLGIVIPTATQ